ncbi:hypothetical protein NEIG_02119 [Nematocida sp. ERTm5]|nr:hypothetical protein NEIG_02119 [Nematocida sp. ERTm5]
MLPSEENYLSIYTNQKSSFTEFLNHRLVKKYSLKILAALLLLAEGLKIPVHFVESGGNLVLVIPSDSMFDNSSYFINMVHQSKYSGGNGWYTSENNHK